MAEGGIATGLLLERKVMRMRILNFGALNIDYVYSVDHMVQKGETLSSDGLSIFPGGKGLNQSVAMGRAGAPDPSERTVVFWSNCWKKRAAIRSMCAV